MASSSAASTTTHNTVPEGAPTSTPPRPALFIPPPRENGTIASDDSASIVSAIYDHPPRNDPIEATLEATLEATTSAQFVASLNHPYRSVNHRYRPDHWELFRKYHSELSETERRYWEHPQERKEEEAKSSKKKPKLPPLRSGTVLTLLDVTPENGTDMAQGSTATLGSNTAPKLPKMQLRAETKIIDEFRDEDLHLSRNSPTLGSPTQQFRTILAENVSPEAIMFLWSSLNLDPQAYSEYITGSIRTFPEMKPASSKIPQLRKRHLTFRWSRLVILRPNGLAVERRLRRAGFMSILGSVGISELGTNIYRKSSKFILHDPNLFGVYLEREEDSSAIEDPAECDSNTDDTVRAWDEQATICWVEERQGIPSYPAVLLCTDPIPHSAGPYKYRETLESSRSIPISNRYGVPYCYGHQDVDGLGWRGHWDPVLQARVGDEQKLLKLRDDLLNTTPSTGHTVEHWMKQYYYASHEEELSVFHSPEDIALVFLLEVVFRDSLQLLTVMSEELRRLNGKMHGSVVLDKNLDSWLKDLAIYREELQKVSVVTETALEALHEVATVKNPQGRSFANKILGNLLTADSIPETAHELLRKCFKKFLLLQSQVQSLRTAIQDTSNNLTSNLSIFESRKAIQEAESVTKLTELAFFFVPLGFAASIFGMQIQEFGDAVPIRTFFLTALVAVVGSYILRLFVRSKSIEAFIGRLGSTLREIAQLSDSEPIPVREFLKFGLFALLSALGALVVHVIFLIYVCWQIPYALVRGIWALSWEKFVDKIDNISLTYKFLIIKGLLGAIYSWYSEEQLESLIKAAIEE